MYTFLMGVLGGALFGSSYVLLNTPRSGKENQRFVKDLYETTKLNVEDVQDKAADFQEALNTFNTELSYAQNTFIPDIKNNIDSLMEEVDVYKRRITDSTNEIKMDVEAMNERIDVQKNMDN